MLRPEQMIAAQVLLIAASGRSIDGSTPITAENIESYRPAEETVQRVSEYFESHNFEVSPLVGISFTISASVQHFSEFFNVSLTEDSSQGVQVITNSNAPRSDLPLDSLEPNIACLINSIVFTPPPDFGPTNFGE
jgi:subtilase family serine protease